MRSLIAVLLPAMLLAGCASTTEVSTRYISETRYPPASPLLLVAHTPEGKVRETWELTCRDIFSSDSLTILLSHQEIPLWYEGGKERILGWAQDNDVDRILVVELTHLLIDSVEPPQPVNQLNAMNQPPGNPPPTWEVGIGGELKKAGLEEALRQHGAELINAQGSPIWTGVATTHEANEMTAIAKSQCTALRKTLREQGYL